MKTFSLIFSLLLFMKCYAQEDYVIKINDAAFSVGIDKEKDITINGKTVKILLTQKDTLTYTDPFYSFKYLKGYSFSTTLIEENVHQLTILSAEGSGFIIQKYETINPSSLLDFMLNEITKENIDYGYKMTKTNETKKLVTSQELVTKRARLTYNDDVMNYEIATLGSKDKGFVIITILTDDDVNSKGRKLIDLMWRSLRPLL